jgi:hypothetical protein
LIVLRRYQVRMNDKPSQVTDLKEAQLLINQLWADSESLTEKIHLLEKQVKEENLIGHPVRRDKSVEDR